MVQANDGVPADSGPVIPAQPHQAHFPEMPQVPQLPHIPQMPQAPQMAQVPLMAQVPQMIVDPKAQIYPDAAAYSQVAGQMYPETASQQYPAAPSQSYDAASRYYPVAASESLDAVSQLLPVASLSQAQVDSTDAMSQMYPISPTEPFVNVTAQLYSDASSQLFPISPQPYTENTPPLFPVVPSQLYADTTSQLYRDATTQLYPSTTAQPFADNPAQMNTDANQLFDSATSQAYDNCSPQYSDATFQLTQNPFSTAEPFVPSVNNYQQPALNNTPALGDLGYSPMYNAFGTNDIMPTKSVVITPDLIPEYNTTSPEAVLHNSNPFELVCNPALVSPNVLPKYSTSAETVLDNSNPFDFLTKPAEESVMDSANPFELVSKTHDYTATDNSTPSEVVSSGHSTFQVIPVVDVSDYSSNVCVGNVLLNVASGSSDSIDSTKDSEVSGSNVSDVYMNSDYTDTMTSVSSTALLLAVNKCSDDTDVRSVEEEITEKVGSKSTDMTPTESFYANEAFDSGVALLGDYKSEDANEHQPSPEPEVKKDNENYNWIVAHNSATLEAEHTENSADKKAVGEIAETAQVLLEAPDCVESLVHQLAQQHSADVVALHVEVLGDPVYQPLTEPIWEEEEGSMNSQESLNQYHQYKITKQGRQSAVINPHEHKSFLNLTAASVTSLGNVCQKALGYVRSDMEFGSVMSLGLGGEASRPPSLISLGSSGHHPAGWEALPSEAKKKLSEPAVRSARHMRNLIYISVLATILLISLNATRNLQSSLNQKGGVGITSLAISFACYTLGSILSPVVVQKLGVRRSIIFGLVLQLAYVASNLHPVMWLMAPSSAGGGLSLAIIWNAASTYIVMLARGESSYRRKVYERVSNKFFGIFCLIYQCNLVVGNLISSLILTFGGSGESDGAAALLVNDTFVNASGSFNLTNPILIGLVPAVEGYISNNDTVGGFGLTFNSTSFNAAAETHHQSCGSNFCHDFKLNQTTSTVSANTKYLLFGIFMLLIVLAILIAVFLLEPLCLNLAAVATHPWKQVKRQVVSLLRFSRNTRFLLLLPLLFYSNMQFSFVCSEVMMAFVTCPVGIWMVGYTMMVYGFACGLASYITQALVHRTSRTFFIALVQKTKFCLLDWKKPVYAQCPMTASDLLDWLTNTMSRFPS